jgi:cytochrome c oxidase cbb3-type subunit 2
MKTLIAQSKITVRIAAMAALLAVGMTQGGAARGPASGRHKHGSSWDFTPLERVSEKDRARQNPLEGDPDAVRAGQKLFAQHCAECHGEDLGGSNRGISLISDQVIQASPGALFWILTNGVTRRGMPVWSKLPEPQRWQLVAFLKSAVGAP